MGEIVETGDVLGGQPRIEGRRIGVLQVHEWVVEEGQDPVEVAADFDLELADVYRALTYYYDNVEAMRSLKQERRTAVREGIESQPAAEFRDEADAGH